LLNVGFRISKNVLRLKHAKFATSNLVTTMPKNSTIHTLLEEDGVLSFEWTLLVTLLVIGIVAGVSGARDAIIDELGDAAQAMLALDDSFSIAYPLQVTIDLDGAAANFAPETLGGGSNSGFIDRAIYQDCARLGAAVQQPTDSDVDS
jgi:Flp pilus assembly pilin Flp